MNKRPPSGKTKRSEQLLNKEQQYKELNAALEQKSATLISEAESVLRGQDDLFSNLGLSFNSSCDNGKDTTTDVGEVSSVIQEDMVERLSSVKSSARPPSTAGGKSQPVSQKAESKQRPTSGPAGKSKKKPITVNKQTRAKSVTPKHESSVAPDLNLIEERAFLANRINTLELEAADDIYTPVQLEDNVLPDAANDIGSDATIRFLKAKLRVMQEELETMASDCREKIGTIGQLEEVIREREDSEAILVKKNEHLETQIEKLKSTQEEIRSKNSQLESELSAAKKDRDGLQREKKQTSASKNTLELRLNRALEEVDKHKGALKSSRESSAVMNNTDRKRMEQLQTENKKLEKQKTELITAFKKQMKLIDILKRQKMHIEAAKLLEFSEEEFVRALEWGKP